MLERKRLAKLYQPVPAEDDLEFENSEELHDLEAATAGTRTSTPPVLDEARGGSKVHAIV